MYLSDKETAIRTNIIALESLLFKAVEDADEAVEHLATKDLTIGNIDAALGAILDLGELLENALTLYKAAFFLRCR
jgi:hypothetical protein